MNQLANELNLSNEELELYEDLFEFERDAGHSGEGNYGYYTHIPEGIDNDVMKRNKWNIGDPVWLSHQAFEDQEYNLELEENKKATDIFEELKNLMEIRRKENHDSTFILDSARKLGLSSVGEINSLNAELIFEDCFGQKILLKYKNYDPSGPFQNLEDITKIDIKLINNSIVIDSVLDRFEE